MKFTVFFVILCSFLFPHCTQMEEQAAQRAAEQQAVPRFVRVGTEYADFGNHRTLVVIMQDAKTGRCFALSITPTRNTSYLGDLECPTK